MTEKRCPKCGFTLPGESEGVCPRCAITLAIDGGDVDSPDSIDRYDLVEKVGEGGMGEVWLAEQREPVRRRVAIKILKQGLDADSFIARFQGERQALALMDHAAVAKIFDAGTTPKGRPYFVMEYVPGQPITEYCDRERLTIHERLELAREVCAGVQHAHQQGIVHRDLKPSNVLVVKRDGKPTPKIIDFGIAKAIGPSLTGRTLQTEAGMIVGTPEYMSPEQADALGQPVDTRTDVYSLGVLLYEILSGSLPFDPRELRAAGLEGIRRVIREVDPPTPSTRLRGQDESSVTSARDRRTDPVSLARQLSGDLDWIVMKALEKDRERRYSSAAELAADLLRHLSDEPVLAGPPSATYRARKFVRRHRTAVAISVTALLALVAGLVATTTLWTLAQERYEQVLRLADLKRVRDYRAEADLLWPAHPQNREGLERWLHDKGEPLAANLERHRRTLDDLRATAAFYGNDERERDRSTHPRLENLKNERTYVEQTRERVEDIRANYQDPDREEVLEYYESRIEQSLALIEELEVEVSRRRTWEFGDEETNWQHEMLTELVEQLGEFTDPDPFVGTVASVRRRLEFASTIGDRSVSGADAAASWAVAIDAIARSPRYAGLVLTPQVGLLPLGENPRTGLWEFRHIATGSRPVPVEDSTIEGRWSIEPETGMVFVLIPGGSFLMGAQGKDPGAPNYDPDARRREERVHQVDLDPFFLSRYEMTQGQWRRLAGRNTSRHAPPATFGDKIATEAHPVEMMTWFEANDLMTRHGLVLPTEAQWEYAVRAGTTTPWWTGSDPAGVEGAANILDQAMLNNGGSPSWTYEEWLDDGYAIHAPVGTFAPNPWGLHETIGNVDEWCRDYYQSPYHKKVAPGDGMRLIPGATRSHVTRGGSWRSRAVEARSGGRGNVPSQRPDGSVGLRPARRLDGSGRQDPE